MYSYTIATGTVALRGLETVAKASPYNRFSERFHGLVKNGITKVLQSVFVNGPVPCYIEFFEEL